MNCHGQLCLKSPKDFQITKLCSCLSWKCTSSKILNISAQTNSADPDQTASEEAVWSGSSLFAFLTNILWIPALITHIFFEKQKVKSVQNLRTFTVSFTCVQVMQPYWRQPRRETWLGYRNWPHRKISTVVIHREETLHHYILQVCVVRGQL